MLCRRLNEGSGKMTERDNTIECENGGVLPYDIGLLPFLFEPLFQPTNGPDLPDSLPFSIDIDSRTGTMIRAPNGYVS